MRELLLGQSEMSVVLVLKARSWPFCLVVAHRGFEPLISALRGRCPGPLDECATRMAGDPGFEPGLTDSESAVLPLDESPAWNSQPRPIITFAVHLSQPIYGKLRTSSVSGLPGFPAHSPRRRPHLPFLTALCSPTRKFPPKRVSACHFENSCGFTGSPKHRAGGRSHKGWRPSDSQTPGKGQAGRKGRPPP